MALPRLATMPISTIATSVLNSLLMSDLPWSGRRGMLTAPHSRRLPADGQHDARGSDAQQADHHRHENDHATSQAVGFVQATDHAERRSHEQERFGNLHADTLRAAR